MRLFRASLAKVVAASLLGLTGAIMAVVTIGVSPALAVGGGGAGVGAPGATGFGAATSQYRSWWQSGNADARKMTASSLVSEDFGGYHNREAESHFGTIFSNWGNLGPSVRNHYAKVVDNAVLNCQKRNKNKCTNPRVALMGVVQIPKSNGKGGSGFETADGRGWMPAAKLNSIALGSVPNSIGKARWKINNHEIKWDTKLSNGQTIRSLANSQIKNQPGNRTAIVAVVLSNEDFGRKGWRPTWTDYKAFDIKTTSNETTVSPITGIAEYSIHVEGYDGYVKGMSTTPKSYQTPFGSLLAAVNSGKNEWTWNGGHGTEKKTFKNLSSKVLADQRKNDPSGAVSDANANIKAAAEWAIAQTDKMDIDFKIEDAPGVDGMTGKQITEAFKKGGQYKIVKKRKIQTIQFTGMNVDYYRRTLSGYYFNGWASCNEGESGCSYIGKTKDQMAGVVPSHGKNGKDLLNFRIAWKCPAPTGGKNDPYESCIYRGPQPSRGQWEKMAHGPDRTFFVNAIKDKNYRWDGRILWTVQAARNDGPNEGSMTLGRHYKNGFKWLDPNWEREAYAGTNDKNWITTEHFKPAPNSMQSPVVVALQDFAHMNCNKADFDKYVDYVRSLKTPQGDTLLDEGSVKSTKYDGYFNTKLVTDPNPVNVKQQLGSMTTVLLRQPGNTVFKAGDKLTNGKEPTLANWQIQWGSTTWNTSGKNSGQIDPTYTKECPFDCVADTSVVRSNIRKGVANDPQAPGDTRTSNDILAKDAYGVQVWPNKNGQDPDLNGPYKANTSHMQFFRNNEWNYFTVDRWAPASTDGIRYDGGDAKSTTIVRNADGTPWMANGTRLTNMDANAGGWKPLFNGNGNVVNQWASSTNDRFDTKTSNQIGGQATQFRIKSAWATKNGKPLKFNVKWEYEVDNTVRTPTVWKIRNNGTNLDTVSVASVTTVDQTTKVDGKCDSQFNRAGQVYQDHTDYAQQGTGVTHKNTQDVNFEEDNPMKGWFSITFVRATAE